LKVVDVHFTVSGLAAFSPLFDIENELWRIADRNVLEELNLSLSFETFSIADPTAWRKLDDVLSTGFPSLQKLTMAVKFAQSAILMHWQTPDMMRTELRKVLQRSFSWSKKNLDFTCRLHIYWEEQFS
jgi:hypothetical protein